MPARPPPGLRVGHCRVLGELGSRVATPAAFGHAEAAHLELIPRPQVAGLAERQRHEAGARSERRAIELLHELQHDEVESDPVSV